MKVFLKIILMALMMAVKSSCVKIADKESARSKPVVDEQSLEEKTLEKERNSDFGFRAQVIPGEELHEYSVFIEAAPGHPARLLKKLKGETLGYLDWSTIEESYLDTTVRAGDELEYQLIDENNQVLSQLKVQVPRDLVIEGRMVLKKHTLIKVGRLRFAENAILQTNEYDLEIQARRISAERGAEIINFPLDKLPRKFKDGRSGGEVIVIADEAYGDLNITLTGEPGSQGKPGSEDNSKLHGQKGAPGEWGYSSAIFTKTTDLFPKLGCRKIPQNGKPGSPGQVGDSGRTGYRGGDSGILVVDIIKGEELRLLVERFPGGAGQGGPGGPGGIGGQGGDPGLVYTSRKRKKVRKATFLGTGCPKVRRGQPGADGSRGPQGLSGAEGEEGKICLKLRASDQFECR